MTEITGTGPLPEVAPVHEQQQNLAAAQELLGILQQMMGVVHNSDYRNEPAARQLWEITRAVSSAVKDASRQQGQESPGDREIASGLIRSGELDGAVQHWSQVVRERLQALNDRFARLQELEGLKPVPLPVGTNLATLGAGKLAMPGSPPPEHYRNFIAAHPGVHRLIAAQQLQWLIAGGDDGARACLALLTAIIEYGDSLFPHLPEMRVRPPAGSPHLPVYDRAKHLLEHFEHNQTRVNLLNPARLSALVRTERETSTREMVASLQTQPTLKKDAPLIAVKLRDRFETYVHREFAPTPEYQALEQQIVEVLQPHGLKAGDGQINLLANPHLDAARCLADLADLLQQEAPATPLEQHLETAVRVRAQVNRYHQEQLAARAAALYRELGGNPELGSVAVLTAGNMADASGIPLTEASSQSNPDYSALLNNGHDGTVSYDGRSTPHFVSREADADGVPLYRHAWNCQLGRELATAFLLQPVRMDTERHYDTAPAVTVSIAGGAAAATIRFHKKGEKQLAPEVEDLELPAGMRFEPELNLLSCGPRFTGGESCAVTLEVKSKDPLGAWQDFSLVVARTVAPRQQVRLVDAFAGDQPQLKPDVAILPEPVVRALVHWLRQGAGLEFAELIGGGADPQVGNVTQVDIHHHIDRTRARGTVVLAIRSWTDAQPAPRYRFISPADAQGNCGCSQDRSVAAALAVVAALQQELADDAALLDGLRELEQALQMLLLLPVTKGTGRLKPAAP